MANVFSLLSARAYIPQSGTKQKLPRQCPLVCIMWGLESFHEAHVGLKSNH